MSQLDGWVSIDRGRDVKPGDAVWLAVLRGPTDWVSPTTFIVRVVEVKQNGAYRLAKVATELGPGAESAAVREAFQDWYRGTALVRIVANPGEDVGHHVNVSALDLPRLMALCNSLAPVGQRFTWEMADAIRACAVQAHDERGWGEEPPVAHRAADLLERLLPPRECGER